MSRRPSRSAEGSADADPTAPVERDRIDRWLWCARFYKTRGLAAAAAAGGKVRLNGARVDKAGCLIKRGDLLTFARGGRPNAVVVVEVVDFATRRGPAEAARALYREIGDGPRGGDRATGEASGDGALE